MVHDPVCLSSLKSKIFITGNISYLTLECLQYKESTVFALFINKGFRVVQLYSPVQCNSNFLILSVCAMGIHVSKCIVLGAFTKSNLILYLQALLFISLTTLGFIILITWSKFL